MSFPTSTFPRKEHREFFAVIVNVLITFCPIKQEVRLTNVKCHPAVCKIRQCYSGSLIQKYFEEDKSKQNLRSFPEKLPEKNDNLFYHSYNLK